nr:RNA helicase [Kovacikia minuta]
MGVTSPPVSGLDLKALFPFELDDFQLQAIAALEAGRSVVVCAPTGSGKTLIGEYAIHRALKRGRRVFYTTPLKALSNQKLRDFRDLFGAETVGLLTGDVSINRDAPILVMTTEIFRNMLYGTPIGEVGTSLVGVEAVVLDECHYMNDRQRGTVWEESIIYCPPEIQLVALSATVANSDQLTDWIHRVHGPTDLIYSDFRPVPLQFHFCNPKGLFPLLDDSQKRMNPRLKPKGGKGAVRGGNRRGPKQDSPGLAFVVTQLQQRDMLPAIYFIFSRRGCDQAMAEASKLPLSLVNASEAARLQLQIDEFLARNPEVGRAEQIEPLYQGIAAHHAGVLPAWKGLIEELFQQGLIKVVFATETLAAGINMPARTTVISSLSKRTDLGHRLLNASEFLQMSGRAGRRGMDSLGYVVTVQTPFEGAREASYLATVGADPLVSQFTPSYGMVLNLLQTHTLEEARELVERSFGQYLSTLYLRPQQEAIAALETELAQLEAQLGSVNWNLLAQYEKLQERLKEERRLLKILQGQAQEVRASEMPAALSFAVAGTVLTLKWQHVPVSIPLPAVLVTKTRGSGQFPYLVCLGQDNRWYVVTVSDVISLRGEYPRLAGVDDLLVPESMPLKPGQSRSGDDQSGMIARQIPVIPALVEDEAPEIYAQTQRMLAVQAQIESHPVNKWGNRATILKRQKRMTAIQEEIRDRQEKLDRQSQRHWEEFLALIDILQHFGCLDRLTPTELGQATAAIRGDNELWLGLALMSGELNGLTPSQLAAACAALVVEVSRPDSWTRYDLSGEVEEALAGLRGIRRRLFQLQRKHQVVLPVWLEYELVGLVEQWAAGVEWLELCANTSLDEGDVVRILRRTLDFLSQIPHVPYLSAELKANARRAIQLLDRFPVNEGVE